MIPVGCRDQAEAVVWTLTTREQHNRKSLRYQTDLTDAKRTVIEPHLPPPRVTGRPRVWPMREIINAIFYVMRAGCPWRLSPKDLPPWGTIYRWFATLRDSGQPIAINHALFMDERERAGRDASPSGAIVDRQSVEKRAGQIGFAVQPRRWVVERFFAWINCNRRLAANVASANAFLYAVSMIPLFRWLVRSA